MLRERIRPRLWRRLPCAVALIALALPVSPVSAREIILTPVGRIPASTWEIAQPVALDVDHHARLCIVDSGGHRVLIGDSDGDLERELGGYGWAGDRLDGPLDVVVDPGLAIYVLDAGNRRVVEYDADGEYLGVAVAEERLGDPVGLELGSGGELYVTDSNAQLVRVFSQFGEELDPIGAFGGVDGGLVAPTRIAMGPGRRLAVSDPAASAVWLFDEFGTLIRRLAPPDGFTPLDVIFAPGGALIVTDPSAGVLWAFDPESGEPLGSARLGELDPAVAPRALALDRSGRLFVLDGISGDVLIVELVEETNG